MVPPTPPDDQNGPPGMLLDGTAHSAQWRDKEAERQAAEARKAVKANAEQHDDGIDDRYNPPTELLRSLMIPADQLPRDSSSHDTDARRPHGAAGDTYMENLIAKAAGPTSHESAHATDAEDGQTATDRFFEQQAITPPRAAARQTIAAGTASLPVTDAPARRRRSPRRLRRPTLTRPRRTTPPPSADPTPRPSGGHRHRRVALTAVATILAALAASVILANTSTGPPRSRAHIKTAVTAPTTSPLRVAGTYLVTTVDRAIRVLAQHRVRVHRHHPRPRRHPAREHHRRGHHAAPTHAPAPALSTTGSGSTGSTTVTATRSSTASSPTSSETSSGSSAGSSQATAQPAATTQSQPPGPTGPTAILGPGHCNC